VIVPSYLHFEIRRGQSEYVLSRPCKTIQLKNVKEWQDLGWSSQYNEGGTKCRVPEGLPHQLSSLKSSLVSCIEHLLYHTLTCIHNRPPENYRAKSKQSTEFKLL